MVLITSCWCTDIFAVIVALVAIAFAWIKWSQTYWSRKGIDTPRPTFLFGHSKDIFLQKQSFGDFTQDIYNHFKKANKRHGGFYFFCMPTYLPLDPEIIKHIMQTDFDHFVDRGVYLNEEGDPLSAHLFSLEGTKWRNLRAKLTPTFTSGKLKMMFEILTKCGDQLITEMDKNVGKSPVDIKNMLERFTTDIIGNCAFGINCNSLKDPDGEFTSYLRMFFFEGFWRNLTGLIAFVTPGLAKVLSMKAIDPRLSKFFMKVVKDTVDYREKNNVHRNDFMHLLLQLKNRGKLSDDGSVIETGTNKVKADVALTFNEVAAQALLFFLAGYETSSTTMTFSLFELAANPHIQDKLRAEISKVLEKHDNKVTYEAIMEMHYLDQVVNETLRKYPPLPGLNRICNKEYKVPGTDLVLEKGTKVWIPVLGIQRDPQFYPNPEKYDPDRFSEENKRQRPPYTFFPFGEGPRICIGLRFGTMQSKVGLTFLLNKYKFSINSKTNVPLQLDARSFVMTTKGGIWLDYTEV